MESINLTDIPWGEPALQWRQETEGDDLHRVADAAFLQRDLKPQLTIFRIGAGEAVRVRTGQPRRAR